VREAGGWSILCVTGGDPGRPLEEGGEARSVEEPRPEMNSVWAAPSDGTAKEA
jgi:hypothetical protein